MGVQLHDQRWDLAILIVTEFKPDASFDDSIEGSVAIRSHQANIIEKLKQSKRDYEHD